MPSAARHADQLQQRRRDVGQHAVAQAPALAPPCPASSNGTGFSECAVTGPPCGVPHLVGVAVVGGDASSAPAAGATTRVRRSTRRPRAEAAVEELAGLRRSRPRRPVWPTMSGLAKLATMKS